MFKLSLLLFTLSIVFTACASQRSNELTPTPTSTIETTEVSPVTPYTATFEIYTNGTKRVFTQPMYHRQSASVFIDAPDPSVIFVEEANVTWADFFATLPFSVSEECLITGTGQRFCSNQTKQLRFILNGEERENVLERPIQPEDHLLIRYE